MEFEEIMRRVTWTMGSDDCTEEDIEFLLARLDRNGDTTVSKDEFQRLINILVKITFPVTKSK